MQVIDRIDAFRKELDAARMAGKTVGLVPTMGYLHEGHASLIRRSAAECDVTAVTVDIRAGCNWKTSFPSSSADGA